MRQTKGQKNGGIKHTQRHHFRKHFPLTKKQKSELFAEFKVKLHACLVEIYSGLKSFTSITEGYTLLPSNF